MVIAPVRGAGVLLLLLPWLDHPGVVHGFLWRHALSRVPAQAAFQEVHKARVFAAQHVPQVLCTRVAHLA
jgi:hypothetical protein